MTHPEQLTGTAHRLVAGALQELAPQLNFIADSADMEQLARKVVGRVLRDLANSTLGEFGGDEPEYLESTRLDELADELEDGVA